MKYATKYFGVILSAFFVSVVFISGCGGGSSYTVGGIVFGLDAGQQIVLQNNSQDDLTIVQDSEFTFNRSYGNNATYQVTIASQPEGKVCTVNNGSGSISGSNVTNVKVACSSIGYTIGGTVLGLDAGETLTLQNNLEDDLSVTTNGSFTFATPLASGASYDVTVLNAPSSKTCSVGNNEGYVRGYNITDVSVVCSVNAYSVGGTIIGLASGETASLQLDLDNDINVTGDGSFIFDTLLADGSTYSVTVSSVPDNKFYNLANNKGVVSGADVGNISVTLCQLSELTELKRLTAESIPPIPSLSSPTVIRAVGDKMVISITAQGRPNGTVYLMDPATYEVLDSHAVGFEPGGFTVLANSEIWVINNDGTITILKINGSSLELIDPAFVVTDVEDSKYLNSVTTDMNGDIWVVDVFTEAWKIDPASRSIVYGPVSFAVMPEVNCFNQEGSIVIDAHGYLWVGQWCTDDQLGFITKIDTDTNAVLKNVEVGFLPRGMAADNNGNVFVATGYEPNYQINEVSSLTEKVINTVTVLYGQAQQLTLDLYGKYIWAGTYVGRDGALGIFDAKTLEEKPHISAGKYSYSVAVDPFGKIWVGNIHPDTVPEGGSVSIMGCP